MMKNQPVKKRALVLCASDPNNDPRPNRMIHWLKDDFDVTVVGWDEMLTDGVRSISLFPPLVMESQVSASLGRGQLVRLQQALIYLLKLATKRYEEIVWSKLGRAMEVRQNLRDQNFDLIVSHDCLMLPLAFFVARDHTKVVLDAREYYPKNYDDQWRWRLLTKPVNQYLCNTYLQQCDLLITVSDGLAREYAREFGVSPQVVLSLPMFRDLNPVPVDPEHIRVIYHGLAGASRKTDVMIEMMDFVDERFHLDLMLMPTNDSYFRKIISMAESRRNVKIIPSVAMIEIVPFINKYDIGLFLCPPTNFNLSYALPNKLFEFIQARLAVAIGPNNEMKKIVLRHACGVVSDNFDPRSMAQDLNNLTPEKIMELKRRSHEAAGELSSNTSRKQVQNLFHVLLSGSDSR